MYDKYPIVIESDFEYAALVSVDTHNYVINGQKNGCNYHS